MTDSGKPNFQVVDRRRSAQPRDPESAEIGQDQSNLNYTVSTEPTSSSGSQSDVLEDTPSTSANANPAVTQDEEPNLFAANTASSTPDASSGGSGQSAEADGGENDASMPDPGALLAYVAMQMDVKSLAMTLLGVFSGQAWRAMGLVANPVTGQTEKNLPEAQIAIDCVQFLLGKVDADLNADERREIQRRLNDLRVNYLAKVRES